MISTCLAKIWLLASRVPGTVLGREIVRARHAIAATAAVASGLLLTAACSSSSSSSSSTGSSTSSTSTTNWATATSAAAGGGMSALVAAAKKEGQLNVITLPSNWANYGTIMKDFTAKYGIKINDANPDGSSRTRLNAVNQLKGQSRAPDVLDVGTAFAVEGDQQASSAPYKVATWSNIPADAKAADGDLLRRLRRLRRHRLQPGQGEDAADLVRQPDQPHLQEPGRHQRQPDQGRARRSRRSLPRRWPTAARSTTSRPASITSRS